jgi:hypothetical protein
MEGLAPSIGSGAKLVGARVGLGCGVFVWDGSWRVGGYWRVTAGAEPIAPGGGGASTWVGWTLPGAGGTAGGTLAGAGWALVGTGIVGGSGATVRP